MPAKPLNRSGLARALAVAAISCSHLGAYAQRIDFTHQLEPILAENCYFCHGPVQQQGGLRMDRKQSRSIVLLKDAQGETELVRRITSKDPAVRMPPWQTSLGLSAGEIQTVKTWITEGVIGEDTAPLDRNVADLFTAVDNEQPALVRRKLRDRNVLNVRDSAGATLLMHASLNAGLETLKLLLASGADPNARNIEQATALIWAADDAAKVRLLLTAGANVNVRTKHGGTALLAASMPYASTPVIAQLLAKGAAVNVSDNDGWTPLTRVACSGNIESMKLLLARGADPNGAPGGLNALNAAVSFGNLNVVRLLLARGVTVDGADASGFTSLAMASLWDRQEIASALIDAGADVNLAILRSGAMRRMPGTPLMLAAYAEQRGPGMAKILISHGADVNFTTADDETALGRARVKGETAVVTALLEAGAKASPVTVVTTPAPRNTQPLDVRIAVERSLALLQRSDQAFFKRTGCKSCHTQSLPAMALAMASVRGIPFNRRIATLQSDTVLGTLASQREKMLQFMDDEGPPVSGGYALAGLAAQGYARDSATAAFTRNIAARQLQAGNWHPAGARSPMEYSDVSATALAIRAISYFGFGQSRYKSRIDRARSWLKTVQPRYTEESVFQLLGLNWAMSDRLVLKRLAETLLSEQKADGGWTQLLVSPLTRTQRGRCFARSRRPAASRPATPRLSAASDISAKHSWRTVRGWLKATSSRFSRTLMRSSQMGAISSFPPPRQAGQPWRS
jgi:ankyrin repeat protein